MGGGLSSWPGRKIRKMLLSAERTHVYASYSHYFLVFTQIHRTSWLTIPYSCLQMIRKFVLALKIVKMHIRHREQMPYEVGPSIQTLCDCDTQFFRGFEKHCGNFYLVIHCKKELAIFPSPAGMSLTKLSLAGKKLNYSRPGRVWSVTSRLGTGKRLTLS